jgi:tetratricopeptide (TPR) repeat protein
MKQLAAFTKEFKILLGRNEVAKARSLIERMLAEIRDAKAEIQNSQIKIDNEVAMLCRDSDSCRASGEYEKSLEYAELLVIRHPEGWHGYGRAAQDLVAINMLDEAKQKIERGLQRIPGHVNLLMIANDVFRACGDREKSLEYAELLIINHPKDWNGYGRAAQDLAAMNRFDEAKLKIDRGLQRIPNQINLLTRANDIYRASGDWRKSLKYAELLITYHPKDWNGYGRAAQELVAINRLDEAKQKIERGLQRIPGHVNLLMIANDVFRACGDREKSLEYAELLIIHHPKDWNGYGRAAQDLVAMKRFQESLRKIRHGLERLPTNTRLQLICDQIMNDVFNINRLQSSRLCPANISFIRKSSEFKGIKLIGSCKTYCILLRCRHHADDLAQEAADAVAKSVPKNQIYFVSDSSHQDISNNIVSVANFRRAMGIDWSIIGRIGWLLGDACYYAAINAGLDYDFYFLIEDDVRFSGNSLGILLKSVEDDMSDFLVANFSVKSISDWMWLSKYLYSHPNDNAQHGCLFPVSRASKDAIRYLFERRLDEFRHFLDDHEFSPAEASRYFSNDEAFACNSIACSEHLSINSIPPHLTKNYFSSESYYDLDSVVGDHVVHKCRSRLEIKRV